MKDIASRRKTGGLDSGDIDCEFSSAIYAMQPPSREAGPSTPSAALQSLRMTTVLLNEHAVAVAEEAVARLNSVAIGGEDAGKTRAFGARVPRAGEGRDEH